MLSDYQEAVLRALRRITRAIGLHSRWLVGRFGLTVPQLVCLRTLAQHAEMTPTALSRAVDLSQATVTGIIDRMVKRGLVTRERSEEDRRRVTITLTTEGRDILQSAPPPLQERFADRLAQLSPERLREIQTVLEEIVEMMGAESIDASALLISGVSADEVLEPPVGLAELPEPPGPAPRRRSDGEPGEDTPLPSDG